jgi:hypothetical protein
VLLQVSSEYLTGTITGVLATGFGFLLSTLYERYNRKRIEQSAKIKILSLLSNELGDNLEIATKNLGLFSKDIFLITQRDGQRIAQAPALYCNSSWHIAQANDIYSCVGAETYQLLADTYVALAYSNAYIASREFFRISQEEITSYTEKLLIHDKNLKEYSSRDIEKISTAIKKIEEIKKLKR